VLLYDVCAGGRGSARGEEPARAEAAYDPLSPETRTEKKGEDAPVPGDKSMEVDQQSA